MNMVYYALPALLLGAFFASPASSGESLHSRRLQAEKNADQGLYQEALTAYRELILDPDNPSDEAAIDIVPALEAAALLDRVDLAEALLDDVYAKRGTEWQVAAAVAHALATRLPHDGYIIDGKFVRGEPRGQGRYANVLERDRARAIVMFREAEKNLLADARADAADRVGFYGNFADAVAARRLSDNPNLLTDFTQLDPLPDFEEGFTYWNSRGRRTGAAVDSDGNPVYHQTPTNWDNAVTDGERWRWLLGRMADQGSARGAAEADFRYASFLHSQFGVQTMAAMLPRRSSADDADESGPFAVRTLREDETIARLASGIKRFTLPREHDFVAILTRLANGDSYYWRDSVILLAQIFENRQQYERSLGYWQRLPDAAADSLPVQARERIAGNLGMLETVPNQPAGTRAKLPFVFRNGNSVTFTAYRLDEKRYIDDIFAKIKANDPTTDYRTNPQSIAMTVAEAGMTQYVEEVAKWTVGLDPLPGHYSRRIFVEMPFDQAGCYLVVAEMENGNTSRVAFWQSDLALVSKAVAGGQLFFVADAVTGEPAAKAKISFRGYEISYRDDVARPKVDTSEFAEIVDEDGLLIVSAKRLANKNWLYLAEAGDRYAVLGFNNVWELANTDRPGDSNILYLINDRPVYRPGNAVHFKAWFDRRSYAPDAAGGGSDRPVKITVFNPMGEKVLEKTLRTDEYGGVDSSLTLGSDAVLGVYQILAEAERVNASLMFRLEEYKKPEYEVTVETPSGALVLGDVFQADISARYYFGTPVANAKFTYRVTRTSHRAEAFPPMPWDWLYGRGSWWTGYAYDWAPGWRTWGVLPVKPGRGFSPPEIVAEGEGRLDANGRYRLAIDTAMAKTLYGDSDHRYSITVDVTDSSRRTITGSGSHIAARHPFTVTAWTDKGYYFTGQGITASFAALSPSGDGVAAEGEAALYRLRYEAGGKVGEEKVDGWKIATAADGSGSLRLAAGAPGQYRLSLLFPAKARAAVEGGLVFTVRGEGEKDGDFRYTGLELVPDQREYRPGDTMRLAVNSENKKGVVLLFPRVERQSGSGKPLVIRLDNGSGIHDSPIGNDDQPNFFCEAITVFGGVVHQEVREVFVPPAAKTITVEVVPDADHYAPGSRAGFTLRALDADGKPVAGQAVVAVYDKAVEYISGGSNVGDIREAFWDWKRHYFPNQRSSLAQGGYRVHLPDDVEWTPLGVFGWLEMDWNQEEGMDEDNGAGYLMADAVAAPMVSMDMASGKEMARPRMARAMSPAQAAPASGGAALAEPTLRSEFADTALWLPGLTVDAAGRAGFAIDLPDNLTTWKTRVWVKGDGARVGEATVEFTARKGVMIRPQVPRFLTQKDESLLTAIVNNNLPRSKTFRVELRLEGGILEPVAGESLVRDVEVAANGEARIDWRVSAPRPGAAVIDMRALSDEESDAVKTDIPVIVHGSPKTLGWGQALRAGEDTWTFLYDVPRERLADRSHFVLSFSPTLATALLDAIPYLADYPYGCTEQTLNRFLPAVISKGYLQRLGLSLADAKSSPAGGNDASQAWLDKFGDARARYRDNPVFDEAVLGDMVKAGVQRLADMQNADGGWGWFSGLHERSWPHTTAVVVHGLQTARDQGVAIASGILEKGLGWLRTRQAREIDQLKSHLASSGKKGKAKADNLDAFVYMILTREGLFNPDMRDFLYRDRLDLSLTGLAMFGIALEKEKATNALDMVLKNLAQFVERNPENRTAWLRLPARQWWFWYNDEVETHSWYLTLLTRVDPKGEDTAAVAKYLLENRKNGSYWRSTRDTAYAVESLAEFAAASGEIAPNQTVKVYHDGKLVLERVLTSDNLLGDHRFALDGIAVEDGRHEIRVERSGGGNLYLSGRLDLFSLEDPIAAAGGDLKVARSFHRLVPVDGAAKTASASGNIIAVKTEKYRREPLPTPFTEDGMPAVASGDLIEVELTIDAANDYEYLVFEDMKAAGLEAVSLTSGYEGNNFGAYVEYRDSKVVLFVRSLPRGKHNLSYRFRAETPGSFSALPTLGGGMYATDLRANSDEMKITVTDE